MLMHTMKRSLCSAGRLLPPLVRVDLPRQRTISGSWFASALQRTRSRPDSLRPDEAPTAAPMRQASVTRDGSSNLEFQRSRSGRGRFLPLEVEPDTDARGGELPVQNTCSDGRVQAGRASDRPAAQAAEHRRRPGPSQTALSPFALVQAPLLDSDSEK